MILLVQNLNVISSAPLIVCDRKVSIRYDKDYILGIFLKRHSDSFDDKYGKDCRHKSLARQ